MLFCLAVTNKDSRFQIFEYILKMVGHCVRQEKKGGELD